MTVGRTGAMCCASFEYTHQHKRGHRHPPGMGVVYGDGSKLTWNGGLLNYQTQSLSWPPADVCGPELSHDVCGAIGDRMTSRSSATRFSPGGPHLRHALSDELGEFLQLPLEALQTPGQFGRCFSWFVRRPDRRLGSPTRERRHNDISLHALPFFHGGILRALAVSIIRRRREVNVSAFFLFP